MDKIIFDFNNMFAHAVGNKGGVTELELAKSMPKAICAYRHIQKILADKKSRISLGLEWAMLPFQEKNTISGIQKIGDEIARKYESVISLGIGGSYLGLKAAQDALASPYYNDFDAVRKGRPQIYFDGNNLDPQTLRVLLNNLDPRKTFVIVISKSGETTETKAAFTITEKWLRAGCGKNFGRQIFAITDPASGTLRKKVSKAHALDPMSYRSLPVMKGVGGRFSELNIGLLHLAIIGVRIDDVLKGSRDMAKHCSISNVMKNPALIYALIHTILYKNKAKDIAVMMPFAETLKSTADWYVQLLAESLGKKYVRNIARDPDGSEKWTKNKDRIVNVGRTPVSARGTNDLHSIQQNNIEGEDNKVLTFIKIKKFKDDITLRGTGDFLSGKSYSQLLSSAEEATEWALAKEDRPSCTIEMPEISPYYWGGLIFFFEMATAYEGELLDVNAFDQPGVEGYKNCMYYKLGKPGLSGEIKKTIESFPLIKKKRFII